MTRPWPDLAVLELLAAIAERGSLSAAARSVGMAQPNASRAIARLESDLGIVLVERGARGSRVSEDGEVVVQWARAVLDSATRLLDGAESLRSERRGRLAVAASMTVAEYLVPAWLTELRRRSPGTQVNLAVHNSRDVLEAVRTGACDLGFVESPEAPRGLPSSVVGRDELVVVVHPEHPWAQRGEPLAAADLASTPLVVREPGSGTRMTLEHALRDHEIVSPALELGSNAAVRIAASSGAAPAVLSRLAVEAALRSGELVAIPVEGVDLARRLRAVWRGSRRLAGPAGELAAIAARVTAS